MIKLWLFVIMVVLIFATLPNITVSAQENNDVDENVILSNNTNEVLKNEGNENIYDLYSSNSGVYNMWIYTIWVVGDSNEKRC